MFDGAAHADQHRQIQCGLNFVSETLEMVLTWLGSE